MIQQEKKTHKVFAGTLMCLSFAAALLSLALYVRMPPAEAAASPYPDESEIWADEELPEEGSGEPANTEAAGTAPAASEAAETVPAATAPAQAPAEEALPDTVPADTDPHDATLTNIMSADTELTSTMKMGAEPAVTAPPEPEPAVAAPAETQPAPDTVPTAAGSGESEGSAGAAEAADLPDGDLPSDVPAGNEEAVPVVYSLPEKTVVAPKPSKAGYGSSKNPADTAEVLAAAGPLLNGRELFWSPDRATGGKTITWYRDDTILAIAWREKYGDLDFTFCEIVVGHPSQFRRYLADNSFRTQNRYTPTQMSKTVHAVVGLSGDFFSHRSAGIVVYRRKLYRSDGKTLDTCFIDSSGNLLFVKRNTLKGEKAIKAYIKDNDIVFSLAFGPIMLENGEIRVPKERYPVGQIHSKYTRCSISQLGECHYLFAIAGRPKQNTLWTMAKALRSMGIDNAYALDGGQTATIVINKKVINPVDYASERLMSDILYFATAIPEEG